MPLPRCHIVDPQYGGGQLDEYLLYVELDVLPAVANSLPRLQGARAAAKPWPMMGSSLGGLASCYAGWTLSTTWSPVICMSSSFWWDHSDFLGPRVLHNTTAHPEGGSAQRFWVDWGAKESQDQQGSNAAVVSALESDGWTRSSGMLGTYVQPDGAHNEASWGERVWRPISWMVGVGWGSRHSRRQTLLE